MKILLLILTLVFSINTMYAQLQGQAKVDSLLKELPKAKQDTNRINILIQIGYEYSKSDTYKGLEYSHEALKNSKKIKWKNGELVAYFTLAENYKNNSKFPEALDALQKGLAISERLKNKEQEAKFLIALSRIYNIIYNYYEQLEDLNFDLNLIKKYLNKARYIYKELNDSKGIAESYAALGKFNLLQKNFIDAERNLKNSLNYYLNISDKKNIADIYNSIGGLFWYKKEFVNSLEYFKKAEIISRDLGNKSTLATNLLNLGDSYYQLAQDSIFNKIKDVNEFVGKTTLENLNYSIKYNLEAITYLDELKSTAPKLYCLDFLSLAFEQKGLFKKALNYRNQYVKNKDKVFSQKNSSEIARLEKLREEDLKEAEIEKQKAIVIEQEKREKILIYSAIIVVFLIVLILFLVINSRRKSEKLLLNVLPSKIAKRLKAKEHPIADHFDGASIIFIDLVGFTKMSSSANPKEIVALLNDIFTLFDKLADKHGLEKIKTIGDAYMAVAGIPEIQADHSKRTAQMALDIKSEMKDFKTSDGTEIKFRIGIDCGAVVAGVIGEKKFIYDLWSDAVNTASRMESTGESGQIQITENFKTELEKFDGNWNFTLRGEFEIKGKGLMKTYYLGN